ncbi:acyl-CoA dehydrogenase family protein [Williamsia muralis]|uniref:Acyl-CoA dehydrogenase n=1 Tax=Williamsia marianensis TaxID=85044 RepID=A0A2G3PP01_WILMA|nr:acyl-CoA dehydrogenase family protein [Williamsia marianensis]PHV67567.1 acyl-CoA dehydrogenase [Williamsia marianensis]
MTATTTPPQAPASLKARMQTFITDEVIPVEIDVIRNNLRVTDDMRLDLQEKARAAGVFGPLSSREHGGLDLSLTELIDVMEVAGTSLLGPISVNCSAPDDGNIHLLEHAGTPEQKERYLAPLASGTVRSSIAMTEPAPGAGSDPSMLMTSALQTPTGWIINGDKHFTTGADGAAFFICIADTAHGATMFIVDADNPGVEVVERMTTLDRCVPGGHCIVRFADCEVGDDARLGEVGSAMVYAQARLAPSRVIFCVNWLGVAIRAHHLACRHVTTRTSFGSPIAESGFAQAMIADTEIDIAASQGLIRRAAEVIDAQGPAASDARHDASVAKAFVAEAVWRILDRAVQLHGGLGVCEDHLVARFLVEARAFRIYEGPTEVLRWSIARRALRRLPN